MSKYIGQVPISTIQNISVSTGRSLEEIDMLEEDVNFFFIGSETAEDVSLEFTLTEQAHPDGDSIEQQREELKNLVSSPVENNDVEINGRQGHISVENVNVPESGSEATIVTGSVEGKFLPWPKHLPKSPPTILVVFDGNFDNLGLDMEGTIYMQGETGYGGIYGESYGDSNIVYGSAIYGDGVYGQ